METPLNLKHAGVVIGGFITHWLGGLDHLLTALIAVIILDYITGLLRAAHLRQLCSRIGFRGITRKALMLTVVALSFVIETLTGGVLPLREIVILFFIANEGLSIVENAAQAGLPVPQALRSALAQLQDKGADDDA